MARLCPVCHINKIIRYDMRTCSVQCSKEWKTWSPEHQADMVRQAGKPIDLLAEAKKLQLEGKLDPSYVDPLDEEEDNKLKDAPMPLSLKDLIEGKE